MTTLEEAFIISEYEKGYRLGHQAGWADAILGLSLITAVTSPLPGYADGYQKGQAAYYLDEQDFEEGLGDA